MQPRKNELTAVANRNRFDDVPGGVTDPQDIQRWHQFRADYHRAQQLEDVADFPLQIDFELNSTCQMKCGFCVHGDGKVEKKILGFDRFKKVIDEGARHGLVSIKLNYINEPLLVPDLKGYIDYARSKGVLNVYFATNGLLLNARNAQKLIDAKVSKIMVSLDATTPEPFRKTRRTDPCNQIGTNILRLIDMRGELDYPLVRVNFLKTEVNAHEADDFLKQWTGLADMVGYQEQLNRPGVTDVSNDDDFQCAFPFKLVTVDSNGDILPCCTFSGRNMPLGNVADTTISEAWNGRDREALKYLHKVGLGKLNEHCAHCMGAA